MHASTTLLALSLAALIGPVSAPAESPVEPYYARAVERALKLREPELWKRPVVDLDHSTWDKAIVVTSAHYRLKTIGSRAAANQLVNGLEFMFGQFQELLASDFEPSTRFQIDVLPLAEYNARGNNAAEHSSFLGSFLESSGSVAVSHNANAAYVGILATHSAAHQFIQKAFGRPMPYWISEGLAAYFASYWNPEWSKSELQRVAKGPNWISMRSLLGSSASDYLKSGGVQLIELGMLFKYLIEFNPDTMQDGKTPFVPFLRASVRGQRSARKWFTTSGMQAFEAGFRRSNF